MSDQVEIVAAEDAPSDTESGEAVASALAAGEVPEATTVKAASKKKSVAKVAEPEAVAPQETDAVATEEDEPLVDGPVGEVLDVGSDDIAEAKTEVSIDPQVAEPQASEPETKADEPQESDAVATEEDEPLVDGPVGEVLDYGNDSDIAEPKAEEAVEASATSDDSEDTSTETDAKGNVRILSVGQQVTGTVKRIADFVAFVDIGVGRDGLIHISELSVRRVGKVTDVLAEGQEVTAWIKKLDRDRNRISLTLIDPNTKTIRDLNKDDLVQGTVTRILPYGAFVDIGIGRDALLHVREMGVGYVAKPEDVVKVGDSIEARIIELSRRRGRVDLSLKGLRDEPEPTPAPQKEFPDPQPSNNSRRRKSEPEPEPEPVDTDDFDDLEVLSPMELAFKRAMEAEGMELPDNPKKQGKRNRRDRNRSMQDDIISRTLTSGRK
jgi:predicted RNA-binding protein with RPS1 domain